MALDPMIARGVQPVDISNTLAQVAALRQRDQGLQQSAQQNALYQRKYDDAQAAQAKEDEEDELVGSLLREGRLDEAFAIDPDTASAFAQFKGIDPQTLMAKQRLTQDQSQFETRMGADQQQFNARMALDRQQEARLARAAPDAPKPQLVDVPMPDGTVQKQWLAPGQSSGQPVGAPTSGQPLSPKDTNTARTKLTQVKVARQQLNVAKQKFAAIKDSLSAGPGGKYLPTPAGKAFDAAIDTMRSSITALTKVPGLGSMSDYETRLDQAKFPDRGQYEDVAGQQLQAIEDLLNTVDGGYSEMLGSKSQSQAPQGGKSAPKPGDNVRGYIFIGGNPADKSRWVKAR
jgi:hypothetical protein